MSYQPAQGRWRENEYVQACLVALDISGFSNDVDPDVLLGHRMNFFGAVESTRLFPDALRQGAVKVHFLGDELRLAFLVSVRAREVTGFVDDVFHGLDRMNRRMGETEATRVRGVVLLGPVTWKRWHRCVFLNGELPRQAQRWMSDLAPDQVAVNADFRLLLKTEGLPVDFAQRDLSGETAHLLRS